jgi:eukaryotic-like serine/threonine-protein kinase
VVSLIRCSRLFGGEGDDLDTHDFVAGAVLAERYVLSRRLGQGASGSVWLALDQKLGVDVALKLLSADLVGRAGVFERFARESDLSVRMLSPNVVKVLGGGLTEQSVPYIVYESLEGEDLATRLTRVKRMPLGEMKTILVHLLRGLARAHAVGVLHRDVKPENLFLTVDSNGHMLAKVLDFGVAELTANPDANDPHKLVGTLEYMAPEVFLAERPPSLQSDLYAVGVVAYECCTGCLPRPARTISDLVVALASRTIARAGTLRSEVTPELDAWFDRALHREPEGRFDSAKAMAEALHVAMKSVATGSERELGGKAIRRSSTFEFDAVRRASAQYSMVNPEVDDVVLPSLKPVPSKK